MKTIGLFRSPLRGNDWNGPILLLFRLLVHIVSTASSDRSEHAISTEAAYCSHSTVSI